MDPVTCQVQTCGNRGIPIEPNGPYAVLCGVCGEWIVSPDEAAVNDPTLSDIGGPAPSDDEPALPDVTP